MREKPISNQVVSYMIPCAVVTVPSRPMNVFVLLSLAVAFILLAHADSKESLDIQHKYVVAIDLPPEIVHDLRIDLVVPRGLIYSDESLVVTGSSMSPLEMVSSPNDGLQNVLVEWAFGDVDNSADQDLTINFDLVVANVENNYNGVTLGNIEAHAIWRDLGNSVYTDSSESALVRLVEPNIDIELAASSPTAKAGDEVTYTISVYHTSVSRADAFDMNLVQSIPLGMTYSPGSMKIIAGPVGAVDDSKAQELRWHFDKIDKSWSGTQKILLRYKATIDKNIKYSSKLTSAADLTWASVAENNPERRVYSKTSSSSISIISGPSALNLSMAGYPNPIQPGMELTYTLNYRNRGGNAIGVAIEAKYDDNIDFISADPLPDEGTDDRWTLEELVGGGLGTIKITARVRSSVPDGTLLISSAKLSSEDGASAQDNAITKVMSASPALLIEKVASDQFIRPGGSLNYTITYQNSGNDIASNVTITDIVDSNLNFDPDYSTPRASKIWKDADGTHLLWNASTLRTKALGPGASGEVELRVSMPPAPEHPLFDWVYNNYKIDSDLSIGEFKTLETAVIHSLYVRKKAEKHAYSANETVNYTIIYGNDLALDADNAVVTDVLPAAEHLEFIEAEPPPTLIKDNVLVWNIGKIPPKNSGTIHFYARIKESQSEIKFKSSESVSGKGYVSFDQRLDTAQKPDRLRNYANITADYYPDPGNHDIVIKEFDSSSATIALSDALGTAMKILGHGSGIYSREDNTELLSQNRTIQVKTSLIESYSPSSFVLPQGRSIDYDSKWSEAQSAKNRVTGASLSERYMYATRIDRSSSIKLDKNGSTLDSETSFEGAGHVSLQKQSNANDAPVRKGFPIYESQEDYLGSFKVSTRFDEYGKNVASARSISGIGLSASDKRIGRSQRSFESGTGVYQVEDQIQTITSYMAKDINVSYGSVSYAYTPDFGVNLSRKWREGIWSKSGTFSPKGFEGSNSNSKSGSSEPASFIGEEFSQADYLKKNTTAKGLNEMKTEVEFSGRAEFRVIKSGSDANHSANEISLYDEYIGKYELGRNIEIGGVARFNEPHLSISKAGKMEPAGGTFIDYVITILNDGNRALGPIYVLDLFPPATEYVHSSLRPSELNGSSARWTLVNLGIGASSTIELKLNMTKYMDNLVNRVQASGGYNGQWVSAENFSAIQQNGLSCCPPQIWATKTAYIDSKDPTMVHYSIIIRNREKYLMAASITDQLPREMMFQNSSIMPSDLSTNEVSWNIVDLKPGETKTIDYMAKALQNGIFANKAYIEAHAVNGSDSASADVASYIEIGGDRQIYSSATWRPPACFGLNFTSQGSKDEWIPCDACGIPESNPLNVNCSSCNPSEDGESNMP